MTAEEKLVLALDGYAETYRLFDDLVATVIERRPQSPHLILGLAEIYARALCDLEKLLGIKARLRVFDPDEQPDDQPQEQPQEPPSAG